MNHLSSSTLHNLATVAHQFHIQDFCHLPLTQMQQVLPELFACSAQQIQAFVESWNDLRQDLYMADGGTYRYRRYATLSADAQGPIKIEAAQPHYQSRHYNPLNGGVARHFAPVEAAVLEGEPLQIILQFFITLCRQLEAEQDWHIELHQFRIDASYVADAKPTPEGMHQDGVDYVLMMLIKRENVRFGSTEIFDLQQQPVASFTLLECFETALVNDQRLQHGVTPIARAQAAQAAWRDMLVITVRRRQPPPAA